MNRLLAGGLYKVTNSIVEVYQQYIFSGYKGWFGAEHLRKIIEHRTALSVALHTGLNTQRGIETSFHSILRQVCRARQSCVGLPRRPNARFQSGRSSRMAVTLYAIRVHCVLSVTVSVA
ncbi:hypothetical protein POJ06DRAFT_14985 [Lipomyces tetrasporus]|uniref:Uncharacterized protein n=1 Tax=Lipomyces tetrasporus TaxID=54092 RepID=A0AAD7VW36_9ASCO|nr:uncharacterized protein POJ06DRAFT_14985 [Lipomyces tetrasporus]KAJ8104198.1 hypothetical protein POJ06DRAFT_14985 [Lipomyces tetrasporus]